MTRFISTASGQWTIPQLARRNGLAVSTLRKRLDRFGETATGIQRSLATGIMTREQAGRIGARHSSWRYEVSRAQTALGGTS